MARRRMQRANQNFSELPLQELLKFARAGAATSGKRDEIAAEISRARRALADARDFFGESVQALDRVSALLGETEGQRAGRKVNASMSTRTSGKNRRRGKKRTRARIGTTIQDRIIAVLAKSPAPLKPSELAARMRQSGWTTNAKSPGSMVSVYLSKAPTLFSRKKGGGFSLTPKARTLARPESA